MALYLIKRLAAFLITLLASAIVVFLVLEVLPGDPASIMLGVNARADTLAALRAELGLDLPAWLRFVRWLGGLVSGDLGNSYTYGAPVAELIAGRAAVSVPLALGGMLVSALIAIPLGVIAAAQRNRAADLGISVFAQLAIAVPNFWFAILLILLFSVMLGWLPAGGFAGWDAGIGRALGSLLMPVVALALPQAAILTRVTRSAVLDVLGEDYLLTARAKGLSRAAALWRHGLVNALIPVVTIMGLQFSFLLAGTVIIENVFYLPGLGRLLFQAIAQRDLIVVRDVVVLLAGAVVLVNFLVDLLYGVIDPRLRREAAYV
jgi:peptide/nickel transport system permease protein